MGDEMRLRLKSLQRRLGLSDVPKRVLACVVVAALVLVGLALWRFWPAALQEDSQDFQIVQEDSDDGLGDAESSAATITVDVEGEVTSPGMYELEEGDRVGDAIEKAGGMTKRALRGAVNLAEKLEDGQLVMVAAKGSGSAEASSSSAGSTTSSASQAQGLININTATAVELQALSGIGESISQRIVEYREANGRFESVEDLTKVSGIGETRLASIRDKICT